MRLQPTRAGPKVQAIQHHHAKLPKPVPGEHLWIVASMYQVKPRLNGEYHLDTENLLTIEGPGCLHCEEDWSPQVEARPCPGEPEL